MANLSNKNQRIIKVADETCRKVPALAIPEVVPIDVQVQKLTTGVRDTHIELAKVQLELNLKIVELQLKAQPSTLPEVREQCAISVTNVMAAVVSAVANYMFLF